jgi:hypothetical protein
VTDADEQPSTTHRAGRHTGALIAKIAIRLVQVFGATLKAVSGQGNGPLIPPSTTPLRKRDDYRP